MTFYLNDLNWQFTQFGKLPVPPLHSGAHSSLWFCIYNIIGKTAVLNNSGTSTISGLVHKLPLFRQITEL
jgi:hypothetical protein